MALIAWSAPWASITAVTTSQHDRPPICVEVCSMPEA
jgi:hypothetical protein